MRRWLIGGTGALGLLVAVLVVVRLVTGSGPTPGVAPAPASYDPPATFASSAVDLPREADGDPAPIVLEGFDAFVALPDGITVVDTRTGDVRAQLPADGAGADGAKGLALTGRAPEPPVVTTDAAGHRVAVAAFVVSVPGHGTTLPHDAVQMIGVDVAGRTRTSALRLEVPVPTDAAAGLRTARLAGAADGRIVLTVTTGTDGAPTTYAVDLATGRVAWQLPGLAAEVVVDGSVVGARVDGPGDQRLLAVGLADGRPRWTSSRSVNRVAGVWTAGPSLAAVVEHEGVTGDRTLTLRDAVSGVVRRSELVPGGVTCTFDELATTVCARAETDDGWAAGFDASTGARLWSLPDRTANRVAPRVSTAWHGAVYGTTPNGTVTLDARTGADRPVAPTVAPDLVNAYVGITAATPSRPRAAAHLATS